jgi:hypothetical protein
MTSRLKLYKDEHAIPVKDLSQILGVSKQLVYYWCEFGIQHWNTAVKAASELKCDPIELIGVVYDEKRAW